MLFDKHKTNNRLFCLFIFGLTTTYACSAGNHLSIQPHFLLKYKLPITLLLFAGLTYVTYQLFMCDKHFRALVRDKLSTDTANQTLVPDARLLNKILRHRVAFVIGLVLLFLSVLLTYQHYDDQRFVKSFAIGVFLLNLVGSYLFGSFKRSHQTVGLLNQLSTKIKDHNTATSALLSAQERLQQQTASLASLASVQLNKQMIPRAFFRQLIRQSAETLNVSSVSVWFLSPDKTALKCESCYTLADRAYTSLAPINVNDHPHFFDALKDDRLLAINDVSVAEKLLLLNQQAEGQGAILNAIIWHGDEMIGLLCHEHTGNVREWGIDEKNYVGSLADLLRLAMETHRRQMIESEYSEQQENMDVIIQHKISLIENNAKLFRFIVERAPISIIYLNAANEMIELNPETESMLLCERDAVVGKHYQTTFLPEASKAQYQHLIDQVLKGHKVVGQDMVIKRLDGTEIDAAISISMELDADEQPALLLITQDMTQQKNLERTLSEAKYAAENADRTKTMFVASMSHELRTPLNSVIGFLNIVLQGMSGDLNTKQRDQLNRAYYSAKHLLALVSDVIDISKIEAGFIEVNVEDVNLSELLDEVSHAVEHLVVEKDLNLQITCSDDILLKTDRKRLYQVILNIVSNGLKYTEKGQVDVRVHTLKQSLSIEVADTGIGMDAKGLARLFKPFERIDSKLKIKTLGTGLGLYLTNKILTTQLNGNITVKSKVDEGSVFTVSMPYTLDVANE